LILLLISFETELRSQKCSFFGQTFVGLNHRGFGSNWVFVVLSADSLDGISLEFEPAAGGPAACS
jgi:hypothetical protein